jgi:myosin heavy subunit
MKAGGAGGAGGGGRRAGGAAVRSKRSSISFASVGAQFRQQLQSLAGTIAATGPHYVRCVKPNDASQPSSMDRRRVLEQVPLPLVLLLEYGFTYLP